MNFHYAYLWIIGWTTLIIGIIGYAKLKPESSLGVRVHEAAQTKGWAETTQMQFKIASRLLPTVAITALALLNVMALSKVMSDSEAEELASLFDLGIVVIGAHEIIAYLMILWTFAPLLGVSFKLIFRSGEMLSKADDGASSESSSGR